MMPFCAFCRFMENSIFVGLLNKALFAYRERKRFHAYTAAKFSYFC